MELPMSVRDIGKGSYRICLQMPTLQQTRSLPLGLCLQEVSGTVFTKWLVHVISLSRLWSQWHFRFLTNEALQGSSFFETQTKIALIQESAFSDSWERTQGYDGKVHNFLPLNCRLKSRARRGRSRLAGDFQIVHCNLGVASKIILLVHKNWNRMGLNAIE